MCADSTLRRLGEVIGCLPWVIEILHRIERESRDEDSRIQADQALKLLEANRAR